MLSEEEVSEVMVSKFDVAINISGCLYSFDFGVDCDILMETIQDKFLEICGFTTKDVN